MISGKELLQNIKPSCGSRNNLSPLAQSANTILKKPGFNTVKTTQATSTQSDFDAFYKRQLQHAQKSEE